MTIEEVLSFAYALKHNHTVDLNLVPDFAKTVIELLSFETKSVPEREKGEWIEVNYGSYEMPDIHYQCSCCDEAEDDDYYDFCPNCGADMRGGKE